MSENTDQSQCGADTTDSIPTREQLNAELEDSIPEMIYARYHKRIFKFFMSIRDDGRVTKEEVYEVINAEVSASTKRKYLKQVFEYDPSYCEIVVDLNPSAKAFVDRAVEKEAIDIKPQSINRAKEACEELGGSLFDSYIDYHVENFKKQTESLIEQPIDGDEISVELHERFVNRFGKLVAKELPSELESFEQSMTNIAGNSNEIITIRSLEAHGLNEGEHFQNIASESGTEDMPGDLRVTTEEPGVDPLNIEIKSTNNRERGGAGLARLNNPSIMFGYFESQSELAGNKEELIGESLAVYAPPETLGQMSSENAVAYNTTQHSPHVAGDGETLFFRANVVFAADMKYYHEHGQLPGRNPGHEQEYLD